ncbi:hypothetical protein ACD471_17535|uniref:hypothetical protein n=1 Tax=Clostridioides difficile TaxID=1496 RepID=UPI00355C1085
MSETARNMAREAMITREYLKISDVTARNMAREAMITIWKNADKEDLNFKGD